MPVLVVFGGLPGTGKTALSQALAQERRAVHLRIDVIEQALRMSGALAAGVGPAGYLVGYALAGHNLSLGHDVVADSVNPLAITRAAWRDAAPASARVVEVEVVCSDRAEHRQRVETRVGDFAGLSLPTWPDVLRREYEVWDRARIVVDTAGRSIAQCLAELRSRV